MKKLNFEEKVKGCLVGSVIGAELGFAKHVHPEWFNVPDLKDIFKIELKPAGEHKEVLNNVRSRKCTPFIELGINAYLTKKGRVTPEDFADLLKNDSQFSGPVFDWDLVHTVQELLKEGMNPRLSGLAVAPSGLICAAMPGVGIYHFNQPEYAYLDGIELASVLQPQSGAQWAGLCAAAISSTFYPESTSETVIETVLKLAQQNNKELFYQLNQPFMHISYYRQNEDEFIKWWYYAGGRLEVRKETNWLASNPIKFVLPLLRWYPDDIRKLMILLLVTPNNPYYCDVITPIITGAIYGAINGIESFPKEWCPWAEPVAEKWYRIIEVVQTRVKKEKEIISVIEKLASDKKQPDETILFDKVYGCMLAGAIGNAMGSPVENKMYWEIDKMYPKGIASILEPKRLETEDDNQMAMLLTETYLHRNGLPVMAQHFGKTWKDKLNRDFFYPLCIGNAYDLICKGWAPRITGHWNVVTGSTVMCMEPVAVYNLVDTEYAVIDAIAISYMYQRGLDVTAAAILCAAVSEAFNPDATVYSVCNAALKSAPKQKMNTFDKRKFNSPHDYIETCLEIADKYTDVFKVRKELYDKCLFYHCIDPLELLGFALAMFKISKGDVRQSAIGGTNIGRDSDTISGRAAMLSGTLKGAKSVPEDWIKLFKPEVLENIKNKAKLVTELIIDKKVSLLKKRQMIL